MSGKFSIFAALLALALGVSTAIAQNNVATARKVVVNPDGSFKYPSYVEDIMGPLCFDYGFGPFRWVCLSGEEADLKATDDAVLKIVEALQQGHSVRVRVRQEGYEITQLPGDGRVSNQDAVGMVGTVFNMKDSTVRAAMKDARNRKSEKLVR